MKKIMQIITIALFFQMYAQMSLAADAILPIKATIVQCGARAQLEQACQRDDRCCGLWEMVKEITTATREKDDSIAPGRTVTVMR